MVVTIAELEKAADHLTSRFREEAGRPRFYIEKQPDGMRFSLMLEHGPAAHEIVVAMNVTPLSRADLYEWMKAFAKGLRWHDMLPLQVDDKKSPKTGQKRKLREPA